jgi:hypothetical protein
LAVDALSGDIRSLYTQPTANMSAHNEKKQSLTGDRVQRLPHLLHNFNELPKRTAAKAFRSADPDNLPLQEARQRFLQTLADHSPILEELFGEPLRLWVSLTPAAAKLCDWKCSVPWFDILYSSQWTELDPAVVADDPQIAEQQRANFELLPLRGALLDFAAKFGLMYNGEPATWAMGTVVDTLIWRAPHHSRVRTRGWVHDSMVSHEYPALTEKDWVNVKGLPERELCTILIELPPKQPSESFKTFEKRFNKACKRIRQDYIRELKAAKWRSVPAVKDFTWIDRLAKWQAGRSFSEIDPTVKTPARRAAFSRALSKAGRYLEITPRLSKHNPKPARKH